MGNQWKSVGACKQVSTRSRNDFPGFLQARRFQLSVPRGTTIGLYHELPVDNLSYPWGLCTSTKAILHGRSTVLISQDIWFVLFT